VLLEVPAEVPEDPEDDDLPTAVVDFEMNLPSTIGKGRLWPVFEYWTSNFGHRSLLALFIVNHLFPSRSFMITYLHIERAW